MILEPETFKALFTKCDSIMRGGFADGRIIRTKEKYTLDYRDGSFCLVEDEDELVARVITIDESRTKNGHYEITNEVEGGMIVFRFLAQVHD